MKNRMSSFDVPHKGIRNGLAQLSLLSAKLDYTDIAQVEELNAIGKEVFIILTTHADDENEVSLMHLEEKVKGASSHDMEEHERIHLKQSNLEDMLKEIYTAAKNGQDATEAGGAFYSALSDFQAEYLKHMSGEESDTQALLWKHFTDEELAGHRTEIMKKLNPETLLLWFKYIAPAQSQRERVGLFKGFKANAPQSMFEKAQAVLQQALTSSDYEKLMNALN